LHKVFRWQHHIHDKTLPSAQLDKKISTICIYLYLSIDAVFGSRPLRSRQVKSDLVQNFYEDVFAEGKSGPRACKAILIEGLAYLQNHSEKPVV
jgi:hypothetical protein